MIRIVRFMSIQMENVFQPYAKAKIVIISEIPISSQLYIGICNKSSNASNCIQYFHYDFFCSITEFREEKAQKGHHHKKEDEDEYDEKKGHKKKHKEESG